MFLSGKKSEQFGHPWVTLRNDPGKNLSNILLNAST